MELIKSEAFLIEPVTIDNIEDYKNLIDSIRYICDFNGYDKNFDFREDVLDPALPENGKKENNYIMGFRSKENQRPIVYTTFYEYFGNQDTVFLGSLYVDSYFHGKGYGKTVYNILEENWKQRGFKKLILNVDLKNDGAILFWTKMGFQHIDFSFVCNEVENKKYYMLRLSKLL